MNDKVLHIVEFNKIIEKLTENANSAPAKALCRDLRPMDNLADIRLAQEETDAALQLLIRKGNLQQGLRLYLRRSLHRKHTDSGRAASSGFFS